MATQRAPHDFKKLGQFRGIEAESQRNDVEQAYGASRQLQNAVYQANAGIKHAQQTADQNSGQLQQINTAGRVISLNGQQNSFSLTDPLGYVTFTTPSGNVQLKVNTSQEDVDARTEAAASPFPSTVYASLSARLTALLGRVATLFNRNINTSGGLTGGGTLAADLTLMIALTGVAAGTYGDGTNVARVTLNAQGQVTSASAVPIAFPPIAPTGVVAGTYGDGTNSAQVAINAQGQVTSASSLLIAFPAGASGTIPLAKLTTAGANGSITLGSNGQVTAFTAPT